MLQKPWFTAGGDGVLLVTFDECGGGTNSGCNALVYTTLIGPKIKAGTVSSTSYKHENALRTIMDLLGTGNYPGGAAFVGDMNDFFTTLAGNIDDMPFACLSGHCAGGVGTDTATQLDGKSLRIDLTPNGVDFADVIADNTNSINISSSQTNYSMDFWANISVGANSQAVEFSMILDVGGLEYAFQHQCDFVATRLWRVWNPNSGGSWVSTGRGCSVFGSGWQHFILQFQRNSSNQLVYTGITINNTFYAWNSGLAFNAVSTTNSDNVVFRARAVGEGGTTPPSYTMWIDKWNLN